MAAFRFVDDNRADLPVERMCALVGVARSSFYAWRTPRPPSLRELADRDLLKAITGIYERSRRTYGAPRVCGQLRRAGVRAARSPVARLMRANGLVGAHTAKKWRRGRPDAGGHVDRLRRRFGTDRPNPIWVADISEFPTGEGKVYLAAVRDLYHRGIVGWDTGARQDGPLVVAALTMALARTGHPAQVVHHSDKGTQYTSLDFAMQAGNADVNLSFGSTRTRTTTPPWRPSGPASRPRSPGSAAACGSRTRADAHAYLFELIEIFYNRQRHQAGLGHHTPAEYADRRRRSPET